MPEGRSAKRASAAIQWGLAAGAIAVIAWVVATHSEEARRLLDLTPRLFALISVSAIGTHLLNGWELQVLTARFGARIRFRDTFSLALMVNVLNYLPAKTGTLANGAVLRGCFKVRAAHFGALVLGSGVIHLWVAGSLAGAVLLAAGQPALGWPVLLGPSAALLALLAWGWFAPRRRDSDHMRAPLRIAYDAAHGIADIYRDTRLMAIELLINVGLVALDAARTYFAFRALSTEATFAQSLVVVAAAIVLERFSVIPGGLGFREGGSAAAAGAVGISSALGLGAAVVDRAVKLVWLVLLGVPATLYVSRTTGHTLGEWLQRARAERPAPNAEGEAS
ncbi:MAG: flippase-like domain-containing protein [Coriobacteriia bacterium]|nr:flippase-like domain-containing protein [Coriobacteriia bacterium]